MVYKRTMMTIEHKVGRQILENDGHNSEAGEGISCQRSDKNKRASVPRRDVHWRKNIQIIINK